MGDYSPGLTTIPTTLNVTDFDDIWGIEFLGGNFSTDDIDFTNVSNEGDFSVSQVADPFELWKAIPLGIFLALLCLLTIVGNALVLHAVRTEKRLQTVGTKDLSYLTSLFFFKSPPFTNSILNVKSPSTDSSNWRTSR